jgi:two-component system, chemotaxis family, chemotaxis protein CheY
MFPPTTRFLLVDDMEPLRRVVRSMLKELGYKEVEEAASAYEAIQALERIAMTGRNIDIILSDWQMPGMSGMEFLEFVRATESLKNIPFVMITAEGHREQILAAIQAGVSSYLVKPFSLAQFHDKLKGVWIKLNSNPAD